MLGNKRKITDLKVVELRVELEKRGLDTKGLKGVLVQRLQKSIEDDGGDGSEIEISGSETSSPKPSSRRSIGRSKRAQTDENTESSQDDDKCEMFASNTASEKPGEELSEGDKEQEEDFLTEQIVDEDSSTAFEKTQHPSFCQDNFSHHQDEDSRDVGGELYQDAEEISDSEEKMSIFHENLAQEEGDGKSNNYRTHEEDSMDVPQEEEGGLTEDMMADDWRKEVEESVDNQDELEGSEEVVVEEIETAVVEKWDHVQETVHTDHFQITEPASKLETRAPSQEKKKATNEKDPEVVVVGNEDDVLDMLDYDLEITGEQNNLNVNSEEVAKKTEKNNENGKNTDKKTEAANREECDPSPEKKSRSTADSQQKKSNPDQSKSAKSNSSKDGRKESSKKDTSPNRNLWISGLSSATRASELKSAFSRYGKVIGAKVVTNVKSPGSRCYGYITMTSVEAAKKCILHLNNTEMHGRMITVEVAKGDPSASSKRQSSSSASTSSAKKETDPKDHGKKEISDSKTASTTRKSSSSAQISIKADKGTSEGQGKVDSDKKSDSSGLAGEHKKSEDKDKSGKPKPKSPNRERPRDTTNGTSQRSGDKRHQNRSPGGSNDGTRQRYNKDEPERKRVRQPNSADRKVVLDSHKGELRVNVSALDRSRQGPRDDRPGIASRNIISRRRSISPVRRRPDTSPIRGQGSSRAGIIINRGGRGAFRNRTSRGRGLLSRQSVGSGRQTGLAMLRGQRGSAASQFRVQRDRVRARLPIRLRERGGLPTHTERDRLRREREEREKLRLERERLERERRQLEKDRQERERLEQERLRLEQERKRELERIEREKAEMRRLQEITRYEAEQRQRAIKRSYDDDVPIGHRGSRSSNRDTYESKRAMMASTGDRDGRRADREERRTYGGYNSREGRNGNRAGASPPVSYRSSQNSFRNTGPGKMTGRQIESRRQIAADSHDTDARYIGVGSGATALVRRTEDKYDRRDQGRAMEYGHSYDRESASDRRIESPTRRRGGQSRGNVPNHRDGRKVITRERGDQRGSSPDFRRSTRGNISRIEITRVEQSPPPRRQRRGSSPPTNVRGSTWRGSKGDSSRRDDDRDLREQLRGRQTSNMTASYGDSGRDRERGSQRRAALVAGSGSVSPVRSGGQYQNRWPSDSADSGQIYSVNSSSNPIPTQTGRAGSAASWHSLSSSWQQSAASSGRTGWPGSAMASTTSVGRPIMPSTHTLVPSATAMVPVPPGTAIIPASANQAYLPTTDRQSRSFQTPYKITRRY